MFSPNDLIHLVFADEADTYYCGNLLKLSLHQYLWFKLHETYSSVYFLTMSEDTFSVKTYGDLACRTYEPGRRRWKLIGVESEMGKLVKWMHKQLTLKRSESAAFVCSLEDFCKASEYPDSASALAGIAREKGRTGILVLTAPVSVERSRDLLLYNPVFELLQENAILDVRTGALRDLYRSIKRNKGESCVFLNTFSRERVYSILLHAALEQKGRFLSPKDMETVTGYLVRYLASMKLQHDSLLFKSQLPSPYMQFRDLYDQLKDETVWKRLMNRCLSQPGLAGDPDEGIERTAEFHLIREKSCYAGKCMILRIPSRIQQLDTDVERATDILLDIQRELLRPKNRTENSMLAGKTTSFLKRLEEISPDDLGTYKRVLEAIRFCVTRAYIQEHSDEEEQVLKIAELLEKYINISSQCHQLRRNVELSMFNRKSIPGTLTDLSIQQAKDALTASEKVLRKYQDFVDASIMNLSITSFSDPILDEMEELKQGVERYHSTQSGVNRGKTTADGDFPGPLTGDDIPKINFDTYELSDIDYRHTPPA